MKQDTCWCGNRTLQKYSLDYQYCSVCGTLVLRRWPDGNLTSVKDEGELYSKDYYLKRLPSQYGYPDILSRARNDLSERALYWTSALLKYQLPPANILEMGCSHGGFVAFLRQAGFNATGLELSPWLVSFAKEHFEIPILQGPLEQQNLPPASLDAIVLMDVQEHLPDPVQTMKIAGRFLKKSGFFMVQMPNFEERLSYEELVAQKSPFLAQFKEQEHLHLFSKRAAQLFFERLGFAWVEFLPPIFAQYDMFLIAARQPIPKQDDNAIAESLERSPSGRIAEAALDLWQSHWENLRRLKDSDTELRVRGEKIARLMEKRNATRQTALQFSLHMNSSRIYRIIRKLGRWQWVEDALNKIVADERDE